MAALQSGVCSAMAAAARLRREGAVLIEDSDMAVKGAMDQVRVNIFFEIYMGVGWGSDPRSVWGVF